MIPCVQPRDLISGGKIHIIILMEWSRDRVPFNELVEGGLSPSEAGAYLSEGSVHSRTANKRPLFNLTTDDEIDQYIREHTVSFFHPVATAAMSSVDASWGVVDPNLLSASVLPHVASCGAQTGWGSRSYTSRSPLRRR